MRSGMGLGKFFKVRVSLKPIPVVVKTEMEKLTMFQLLSKFLRILSVWRIAL